jgi:transcription elongation factor GreA
MADQVLAKVNAALNKGDADAVEIVFLEALEQVGVKFDQLRAIARACAEHGDCEKAAEFLAQLVEPAKQKGKDAHLGLLREICICVPHKERWRRQFIAAFQEYYATEERALAFLKASEIPTSRRLDDAFAKLDTLLMLREGGYVQHPGGWGTGKIREVNPGAGYMVVDLQEKRGHRVAIGAAASIFKALEDDHYLAFLYDRVEELKKKAEDDPLATAKILIKSFGGPLSVGALKEKLVPRLVPAEKWSSWWSRVKEASKRDPHVRVTTGAKPSIDLLDAPVSDVDVADEILRTFTMGGPKERTAAVRQCKSKKDDECRARLVAAIKDLKGGPVVELEALLLRQMLGDAELAEAATFLRARKDGPAVVRDLVVTDLARTAVKAVADAAEFDELLPYFIEADMTTIGEAARLCRKKSEEKFRAVLGEVMDQPRRFSWPFFWLYRERTDPQWEEYLACFPIHEVILRLLGLLDYISRAEHREQARDQILFGRTLFGKEKYKTFRAMLTKVPTEFLHDLFGQVQANRAIKESTRAVMAEHIAVLAPETVRQDKEQTGAARGLSVIDESIIYATPSGFKKRQGDFQRLVQVELSKTFVEIGKAQEFGDLSENAEWTAALEKRDRQTQRASEMEAELKKVRIIVPELYQEGRVSLGCEVTVKDSSDNQTHTWRLLGPWDGDQREGVLSYRSPVGRHLLGHEVGDVVTVALPTGQAIYEVLAVTRAKID